LLGIEDRSLEPRAAVDDASEHLLRPALA